LRNKVTLKSKLSVTQGHRKWHPSVDRTSSYSSSIVNVSLSCAVTDIFSVEYWCDLEIMVLGSLRSLKMAPFDRPHTNSCSCSIVTMDVSFTIVEIKRDCRKMPIIHTPFHLPCMIIQNPLNFFFSKILIQTAQLLKLLDIAKILPKASTLWVGRNNVADCRRQMTDRRQTNGSCLKPNVT